MKKTITIGLLLCGVFFLAGCGQQSASQTQLTTPAPATQTPAQPITTQSTPTTPVSIQNYIEVKEFGIKIPVDVSMVGDLTYAYTKATKDVSSDSVHFFSKSLNAVDKNCENPAAGPNIQKILGVPPTSGIDADYYKSRIASDEIKQFNGYFLMFANAEDTCTSGKNVNLEKKLDQVIFSGFKNAIVIAQ